MMRVPSLTAGLCAVVFIVLCYVLGGRLKTPMATPDVMGASAIVLGGFICLFVWMSGTRIPERSLELNGGGKVRVYRLPAIAWGRLGEIVSYDAQDEVLNLGGGRVNLTIGWGGDPQQVTSLCDMYRQRLSADPDLSLMGCLVEKVVVQTANITIPDLSDKAQRQAYEQSVVTACERLGPSVKVELAYPLL